VDVDERADHPDDDERYGYGEHDEDAAAGLHWSEHTRSAGT